ncbi:hypothetical protein H7X64_02275 [Armatimonadetes bacterium]|nr:hypothetical protein [bacterium]
MKEYNELPKSGSEFRKSYWLKEELVEICKSKSLPTSGSKEDLITFIVNFIDGLPLMKKKTESRKTEIIELDQEMKIVKNYSSDENHRRFFLQEIGSHFKFNVTFMNWMKKNSELKTYKEAIVEYIRVAEDKKNGKKLKISPQFEYNQYTRDFFTDNLNLTKQECIRCWNYKKGISGNHKYERDDLKVLKKT